RGAEGRAREAARPDQRREGLPRHHGRDQLRRRSQPGEARGRDQGRQRRREVRRLDRALGRMQEFFQQLVNGITWGSVYALIALGYTMVYGILRLINFAHGDIYMLGAFFGYFASRWLHAGE